MIAWKIRGSAWHHRLPLFSQLSFVLSLSSPSVYPRSRFVAMADTTAAAPANGTTNGTTNGADKKLHDRPQANPDAVEVAKLAGGKPDPAANTAELDKLAKSIDTVQKELVSSLSFHFAVSILTLLRHRTKFARCSAALVLLRTRLPVSDARSCAPSWTSFDRSRPVPRAPAARPWTIYVHSRMASRKRSRTFSRASPKLRTKALLMSTAAFSALSSRSKLVQ